MSGSKAVLRTARHMLVALSCVALILWSVGPRSSHIPKVIETLQEHAEMIASHGHSHGLKEDLIWAMHGHSHDVADHDHSQAVLLPSRFAEGPSETSAIWRGTTSADWSHPHFRLERPPRV